ncbi:PQ loop repeat family protein [Tritrichomonas foetus]|uniref:PQ loop repeat family protein n=1 Tax=Tritrichomonas foetus TaxID=1144522 RepID=A0A1J4JNQ2_9EUKA|nr:PQ loop repeat family protein [Tritrichomonas foetus]|eukprot:OHS99149.1 PQ loop repeat family protein [Tritrichomonas foetus]
MAGCGFSTIYDLSCWLGNLSALTYFLLNFPQLYMNFRRRSTRGFSSLFVLLRLFSISFHLANNTVLRAQFPVLLSGFLLLLTTILYVLQIAFYCENNRLFLLWLIMPFVIFYISFSFPHTIVFTQWIMPSVSLISYIPLVAACFQSGTTYGISVFSQHLNLLGSIFGILMCLVGQMCSNSGLSFYLIGVSQALIVYTAAAYFGEMRFFDPISDVPNKKEGEENISLENVFREKKMVSEEGNIDNDATRLVANENYEFEEMKGTDEETPIQNNEEIETV